MLKKTGSTHPDLVKLSAGAKAAPQAVAAPAAKGGEIGQAGSFGKVAVQLGFISQAQLDEAVREQAANPIGAKLRLGEILIRKGYLTGEQLLKVQKGQAGGRKRIGDFELISKLGEGGMGSVFKARQISMDRVIALKLLSKRIAKDPDFRERFVREARAVAKLNHPHIVTGIDVGSADGYCYFAMEYVDGESLGQYMHRMGGKLPEAVALELIRQVAMALQHAHECSIIHRDIKPDNILLDRDRNTAKLVDLGLARSVENAAEDASLTQAGQCVGTPFYISPEQARGVTALTGATDLYSLGGTLYHALTGKIPFEGSTAAVIMTRHLTDPVPSARKANSAVSVGADRIVTRLLQKLPTDRYASARDLVEDIERVQAGDDLSDGREQSPTPKRAGKAVKPARAREKEPDQAPIKSKREAEPAPVKKGAIKEARPNIVRTRDYDDESENERPATGPARPIRKRRKQQDALSAIVGTLILVAMAVLLYFLIIKPMIDKSQVTAAPPPPPPRRPKIVDPIVDTPPPAAATPAAFEADANGIRFFKFDGTLDHFDVDPNFGMAGRFLSIVADPETRKGVIKLARIRHKESGCMARLILPADLVISRTAVLSFMIQPGRNCNPETEVQVAWDHVNENAPRAVSKWKMTLPKGVWKKVELPLHLAKVKLPSREQPGSIQYIDFFAGKPDDDIEVYLDGVEIRDLPAAELKPEPIASPKLDSNPEPSSLEKETPVVPPPKKQKEPPVVPPAQGDAVRSAL